MSAFKQYLYEMKEMVETCDEQDEYILKALMDTEPEQWTGVEKTYTLKPNAISQKN
ncbi:hypothetical protein Syn8016DRAFT_0807 [Synechococcus sp. WH 8016]|nr:hypothetical protein Syn8016DRAFT_0807 [Synechococcus sp. WH 8016]